jgi:hypothetical protein
MILVVILIAETILNGVFLGENLTGSSAAGMTWAFAFSAVNVSIGLILASLIRNINHVKAGLKFFGYFVALIWLSLVTAFNLLIGHFRDAITNPAGGGMEDAYIALDTMFGNKEMSIEATPFMLQEPVSYFLVAIGIICALVALLDKFFHEDTYPEYGKSSLQLDDFEENLLSLKSEANSEQELIYSNFVREGNKLINSATNHITNLQQTIGFIGLRINEEYRDYFENLAGSFEAVIEQYRTSNKEARDSEPPRYFQDKTEFKWRTLDDQTQRMNNESINFTDVRKSAEDLLHSWPNIQTNIRSIRKEF